MRKEEEERYRRQLILSDIGLEGQERLKSSSVLIIGAGGLGCPVVQYLAAAGVGTIGIVDYDKVELTNLQRQILYSHSDVGQTKAEVAAHKASALNPFIKINPIAQRLTTDNALDLIGSYDIVVDASDNFATRYIINDACVMLDKPLVYAAIHKTEGQLAVFNYQGGPTYRCIYPEQAEGNQIMNCGELGVVATLPGIIGTLQANEVLKILLSKGEVLSEKMLLIDAWNMIFSILSLKLNPANKNITSLFDFSVTGNNSSIEEIEIIDFKKIVAEESTYILDVRTKAEYERFNIGGVLWVAQDDKESISIPKDKKIIVVCQSGKRSLDFVKQMKEKGYINLVSLRGGLSAWEDEQIL